MFGGFGNNGHHGHHGHHKHQNQNNRFNNQGFSNQGQGFNYSGQGFNNQGFNNQGFNQMGWQPQQGYYYKIVSGLSQNMVLDVSQSQHDFGNLILFQYNHGVNQKFYFQSIGGNKYGIFSVQSNKTVEIPQGNSNNGIRVVCSHANKQPNQFWQLVPANFHGKPNAFHLRSFCGKVLDVKGGVCQNESHIVQWDFNGGSNQTWIIQQV